jgi:ribose 5-phosphate isomerase A
MADMSNVKKVLGRRAVDLFVTDGMKLGLGTGSTAIWAVRRVAEKLREGSLKGIRAVTTSLQSELEARALGIPVGTLNDADMAAGLDLTIDGADEVDGARNCIKGGGGALLVEKIVAYASRRFIVLVDEAKISARLCDRFAIPLEIAVPAIATVTRAVQALGASSALGTTVSLRQAVRKAGPVVTDLGNLLLDVTFAGPFDPRAMEDELNRIPGVLENGLFTRKMPELLVGFADGRVEHRALL